MDHASCFHVETDKEFFRTTLLGGVIVILPTIILVLWLMLFGH